MNIFKALKALTQMTFPRAQGWFWGLAGLGQSDYERAYGDGLTHNIVVSPIMWIARAFQEARLAVRTQDKGGSFVVDATHDLVNLLRRPNLSYSGDALWTATLLSLLTSGNAYWAKVRAGGKAPLELWYLPHWMVTPIGDENTFISHYEYRPGGALHKLKSEDIVHLRHGLDPRDPRVGLPPLRAVLREVFSDTEAATFTAALLRNQGVPGLLISPEKDVVVGPEDARAMKDYAESRFTGENRGKPMMLSAATTIQKLGFSPQEMDLSVLRNVSEERVCAALGIPSAIVGFGSGMEQTKVGATMRELVKLAWLGCILPTQRMLAADLTNQLLPDFGAKKGEEVFFDASGIEALKQDAVIEAQAAASIIGAGIATRGEMRQRLGLEVTPADDVFYIPFSAIETPRSQASQPPAQEPKQLKGAKKLTRQQARVLRAMDGIRKKFTLKLRKRMDTFFAAMGADAEREWLQIGKADSDEDRVRDLFRRLGMPKRSSELRSIFGTHYVAVHNAGIEALNGIGVATNLPDSAQLRMLSAGGTQAGLVDMAESASQRVLDLVREARESQAGVAETARRIRDAVPAGPFSDPNYRAEMIARTETRNAQTQSSIMAYRSAEGIDRVMVIDGRLGDTDEDCEDMDGQTMDFDQAQQAMLDEHPNGTRDIVPVFSEA